MGLFMTSDGKNETPRLADQAAIVALNEAKRSANEPKRGPRGPRNTRNGVTEKQERFAQAIVNDGMNYSDAYRAAYSVSVNTKASTVAVAASKLVASPNVAKRIRTLEAQKESEQRIASQTMHHRVIDRLEREANDRTNPPAVRVRALELLGKHVGLFSEKDIAEKDKPKSIEEMESELRAMISSRVAGKIT